MQNSNARRVAIGTFAFRDKADAAVSALKRAGFSYTDIGVIAKRNAEWDDVVGTDAATTNAEESSATGAIAGASAGAGLGGLWALGIAAGLLPAVGPVVAGGILGSVLASAAAGAAAGGIGGALIGLGLSEDEASHYHDQVAAGRIVVTVRAGDRYEEAVSILLENGASISPDTVSSSAAGTPAFVPQ